MVGSEEVTLDELAKRGDVVELLSRYRRAKRKQSPLGSFHGGRKMGWAIEEGGQAEQYARERLERAERRTSERIENAKSALLEAIQTRAEAGDVEFLRAHCIENESAPPDIRDAARRAIGELPQAPLGSQRVTKKDFEASLGAMEKSKDLAGLASLYAASTASPECAGRIETSLLRVLDGLSGLLNGSEGSYYWEEHGDAMVALLKDESLSERILLKAIEACGRRLDVAAVFQRKSVTESLSAAAGSCLMELMEKRQEPDYMPVQNAYALLFEWENLPENVVTRAIEIDKTRTVSFSSSKRSFFTVIMKPLPEGALRMVIDHFDATDRYSVGLDNSLPNSPINLFIRYAPSLSSIPRQTLSAAMKIYAGQEDVVALADFIRVGDKLPGDARREARSSLSGVLASLGEKGDFGAVYLFKTGDYPEDTLEQAEASLLRAIEVRGERVDTAPIEELVKNEGQNLPEAVRSAASRTIKARSPSALVAAFVLSEGAVSSPAKKLPPPANGRCPSCGNPLKGPAKNGAGGGSGGKLRQRRILR